MLELKEVKFFLSETRDHGVGYYQFSKVEEERQEQQNALNKMRAQVINERSFCDKFLFSHKIRHDMKSRK